MAAENQHQVPPPPGLIASLAGLAKNCLHLLLSRLELAALELTEVRDTLLQLSLVFAVAMLAAWLSSSGGAAHSVRPSGMAACMMILLSATSGNVATVLATLYPVFTPFFPYL